MEYEGIVCVCITFDQNGLIPSLFIPGETESLLFHSLFDELFKKIPKWEAGEINGIKVKTLVCFPFIVKMI